MFNRFFHYKKYALHGLIGITTYVSTKYTIRYIRNNERFREKQVESADYIVVGAGTGGCITAYFLAKWLEDLNISGDVILIDSGGDYMSTDGPSPSMANWYENWKKFCIPHENVVSDVSNNFDAAIPSSHIGIGGGSTHDTR
jgi:hypothetical protein